MSRRETAVALADVISQGVGPAQALQNLDDWFSYEDWETAAVRAGVPMPDAATRAAVFAVLRDRLKNPDPFTGFPS